ncbi:MAG: DUF4398 domain-containing protein [Bdellovibrionota bacterium]
MKYCSQFFLKLLQLAILSTIFCTMSCVHVNPPILEYTLADTAIKAAKAVHAVRYSPGHWHEAEESYRQARILYNEREYEQAVDLFNKARLAAEQAENSARLIRLRNGEIL